MTEKCKNPWKEDCVETDIQLYILINKESLPICRLCWNKISDSKKEWGPPTPQITNRRKHDKPMTKQQWQGTRPPTITQPQIKPDTNEWFNTNKEYDYKQRRSKYTTKQ